MKKFKDWVNENIEMEKDSTLDNKEQLRSFSNNKKPRNGDMAYSMYNGHVYVGMLALSRDNGPLVEVDPVYAKNACPHLIGAKGYQIPGYLVFPPIGNVDNPTNRPTLSVGYEGPIVWDPKKGMFYAQPDSD